ncbi:MAG TPA: spore cortex biosynthesis protein YabQ [Bacilli bacterium]|nr:spore cortex biosynthesis protein YabQ [Bacilli bacterium]
MSLSMQYLTVLAMGLSGAVLGAVYDVYRTILTEWRYLRFLSAILDFVYWIFALGLVLWSLQWANHGDVRLYVFLLLGIGLVLYRLLLRKLVVGSTVRMVLAITYFCRMLYRLFLLVVVGPLVWLGGALLALAQAIDRLAQVLETAILWPFGPLLRTIEWTGALLYRRTIQPLLDPVVKPVKKAVEQHLILPIQKFMGKIRQGWKGFLKKVANWLVDSEEDDDPKHPPKR